jgi:hypothetical protein
MVEAIGLKLSHRGPLEGLHLPTRHHENLPAGSKLTTSGGHTDRQTGDLISLLLFLENMLII